MTETLLLQNILDQVKEGREDVKALDKKLDELNVSVEHRLTNVEARAGLFGAAGGFLGALATHFGFNKL